ncbi:G-protein coupled receptor 15 [Trichoplax sp. H2]|nr:G-protein coupled receptor 15 [Trichoplax sp. H2]|eukprot:RDD45698.1 G-protein coupled receptor 15 [Trichoplax sp. H2]
MNESSENNTIDYELINSIAFLSAIPITIIGLVVNLFILYILISDKNFHKTTYYLILFSVLSDIASTGASSLSFTTGSVLQLQLYQGTILCRMFIFIILASYGVSMMTLCIISADRYMAIVKPMSQFYRRYKKLIIFLLQMAVCCISLVMAIPALLFIGTYSDDTKFCDFPTVTSSTALYFIMSSIVLYFMPVTFLVVAYCKIIFHMKNHIRPPGLSVQQAAERNLKKRKFIRSLMSITAAYVLTTWPFWATSIGMAITQKSMRQIRQLGLFWYLLAFASFTVTTSISVVNPFLYLKFDSNIRKKAAALLKRSADANDYYNPSTRITVMTQNTV